MFSILTHGLLRFITFIAVAAATVHWRFILKCLGSFVRVHVGARWRLRKIIPLFTKARETKIQTGADHRVIVLPWKQSDLCFPGVLFTSFRDKALFMFQSRMEKNATSAFFSSLSLSLCYGVTYGLGSFRGQAAARTVNLRCLVQGRVWRGDT